MSKGGGGSGGGRAARPAISGDKGRTNLSTAALVSMYRTMYTIRRFEQRSLDLHKQGAFRRSGIHPYIGQEAVAVGVCAALGPDDLIASTHRGHGHAIAKGADIGRMIAELAGRRDGYCKGRVGSMHIADFTRGNLGANGIAAGGVPVAVGAALASQILGTRKVAVTFFGEGAANQGVFLESLNLASVWKLPVIFVCENNLYAISIPAALTLPLPDVAIRGRGFGVPGIVVDGQQVLEVYGAACMAVKRARRGEGPTLIECKTYRFEGHSTVSPVPRRPAEEVEAWTARDPIRLFEQLLDAVEGVSTEALTKVREEVDLAVEAAVEFALSSPEPEVEQLFEDIYA